MPGPQAHDGRAYTLPRRNADICTVSNTLGADVALRLDT